MWVSREMDEKKNVKMPISNLISDMLGEAKEQRNIM